MAGAGRLSAEELLTRYEAGERDFTGADLSGANLSRADLMEADLSRADLSDADLSNADLSDADLSDADLSNADLSDADLSDADLSDADLSDADLSDADLSDADLSNADLSDADLSNANLSGANLAGADLPDAALTRANFSNANLSGANLSEANLYDVDFLGADLADADLSHVYLLSARLAEASLRSADLTAADLSGADLSGADLSSADLTGADLTDADLSHADLAGANLTGANLQRANLLGAKLSGADLGGTLLLSLDLASLCRSDVKHHAESIVDYRSIVLSVGEPRLKDFLRATGMPSVFVEYMVDCARSLDPAGVFSLFQSTFISYGGPDEPFARKLNDALEQEGVTTFFFKDDAPPGTKLHRLMRRGVNDHDRVILICSRSSLARPGVLNELEETLAREARDGGNEYLIPVRLDDYVIRGWNPEREDLARAVRDRVIADFRKHEDPKSFATELAKLIAVLKKKPKNPIVHV